MAETGTISDFFPAGTPAEDQWQQFEELVRGDAAALFDSVAPIAGARAPGRLDVMGGVADYSGSMVLEMPIEEAACAAWQWRNDRRLHIRSMNLERPGSFDACEFDMDDLVDAYGYLRPVEEVRFRLTSSPSDRWAAYIAGCYYVMLRAYTQVSGGKADDRAGELGANILISSSVPQGAGVSSSAAIEVATMHALNAAAGIQPSDLTLAAWCQRVENTVVGAPCGIMDQVTSALGHQDSLLVLRCQPHDLMGFQRTPPAWKFIGIDSRVKHSVGGSAYTAARVGAFMGLKIIQLESGGKPRENYLCKLSPAEFFEYRELIPESITGKDFLDLYGQLPDAVTTVDIDKVYYPRLCAEHPVLENDRVKQFFGLMQIASARYEDAIDAGQEVYTIRADTETIERAGRLMVQSHESYSNRIKLGSAETDIIVRLVTEIGPEDGLYGAKITGGGAGGTVAVLCDESNSRWKSAINRVCSGYRSQTGVSPRIINGSSPGAIEFGARQIMRG